MIKETSPTINSVRKTEDGVMIRISAVYTGSAKIVAVPLKANLPMVFEIETWMTLTFS